MHELLKLLLAAFQLSCMGLCMTLLCFVQIALGFSNAGLCGTFLLYLIWCQAKLQQRVSFLYIPNQTAVY